MTDDTCQHQASHTIREMLKPVTGEMSRLQVADEVCIAPRGTIALFLSLVGCEDFDGNQICVVAAWAIARCTFDVENVALAANERGQR